jgi:hypothetical protein
LSTVIFYYGFLWTTSCVLVDWKVSHFAYPYPLSYEKYFDESTYFRHNSTGKIAGGRNRLLLLLRHRNLHTVNEMLKLSLLFV